MLPFRSGRAGKTGAAGFFLILGLLCAAAAEPKKNAKDASATPVPLTNIPLPVGQEAKGLVLPDFDSQGHLRARFEAEVAKRTDIDHLHFSRLKMITYTDQNATDLQIEMPDSTLDLNTRVIKSRERTTVIRFDFHIAGDAMSFDTLSRKGTLTGNVKMVITAQPEQKKTAAE